MKSIITLTSDFGSADAYVAAMKGVILGINPQAKLVDISHSIQPQNIRQAAFVLSTAYQFFPQGTVHMAVVDPGVGTQRRGIILRTPTADFVAPDNGVLSHVIYPFLGESAGSEVNLRQTGLPPELKAVAITRPEFWRSTVSPTFHGRDIFAPVAARLSLGLSPQEFGETITAVAMLPLSRLRRAADGSLTGRIIHVDGFGNLITDIMGADLPPAGQAVTIEAGGHLISGLSHTYADGKGLLALIGSSGYLEIALNGGSAAAFLDSEVNDEVKLRLETGVTG